MKTNPLISILVLAATISGKAAPPLLPFQGHLTQSNGDAVDDGTKVVQFKIYDAPVSGNAVWAGEVHKLSVNKGLVNTILGTKTAFPPTYSEGAKVMFSEPLYIEITVDADDSQTITAADPPLLPRQVLLPANFAHVAHSVRATDGSEVIKGNGEIDGSKLKPNSISPDSLNEIPLGKLGIDAGTGGLGSNQIAEDAVGFSELGPNAVLSGNIKNGEVRRDDLADNAVNGTKIAINSINSVHIPLAAIRPDRLELDCATFSEEKVKGPGSKAAGWTPRDLNKVQFISGDSISLSESGGLITLKQGIYWVEGSVPAYTGERMLGKFEVISGLAEGDVIGTGEFGAQASKSAVRSMIRGYVKVNSATSTWRLNHYTSAASVNSSGLGAGAAVDGPPR